MKKISTFLYILLASIFVMPVFVACNGQGATETLSVRFSASIYNVEYNVPTKIGYQIYPSTATNNRIVFTFAIPDSSYAFDESQQLFTLKDSAVTDDIEATITVNNTYTDTCIIRQKTYPNHITFNTHEDKVNSGAVYGLQLKGFFGGIEKVMDPSLYNLEIVSSDPSVLRVEGLNVVSTGKLGTAKISAKVRDANGNYVVEDPTLPEPSQQDLYAELDLTVVPNISRAVVALQGQDEFVNVDANTYEMTDSNKYISTRATVKMVIEFYSADGHQIIDDQIDVLSVDSAIATVTKENGQNNVFTITLAPQPGDGSLAYVRLEITCSGTDVNGNPIKFMFYIARQD